MSTLLLAIALQGARIVTMLEAVPPRPTQRLRQVVEAFAH
jgi:hypothetical protein